MRVLLSLLIGAGALAVPVIQASEAKANTLQMSSDSSVTGWYPNEPQLSPANVTSGDFGEIFDTQLIGQIYAQPLVSQPTVLAVTENDYAYGLNSTTGAIEWQDSFGTPDDPLANIGCGDVGSDLGITGTPVIDSATNTAYFVVDNEEAGNTSAYFMEAVNVQTGAAASGWPAGGVPIVGHADGNSSVVFNANYQTQRPGLVLVNGVVYAAFGSQCDDGSWNGWLVGVSESTHSITTMWATEQDYTTTGNGQPGAGIWQSGSAPVVDSNGDIFVATGNGDIPSSGEAAGNPVTNTLFGEAVVELHTNGSGQLEPVDFFIPSDAPSLNSQDGDLGSGGPVALPASMGTTGDPDPMVEIGKSGILYVLNMSDLGGYEQGSGGTDDVEYESPAYGGVWGKAAVWPGNGGYIYLPAAGLAPFNAGGGSLNVYQRVDTSGALSMPLVAQTSNTGDIFHYGSGSPIVTSNGTTSGSALLWIVHDTNPNSSDSQLEAYNPVPVNPGSSGTLDEVWSSAPFTSSFFAQPSVDNGIIYVGTKDDTLLGFGALPSSTPSLSGASIAFPATVVAQSSAPVTATFTASATTTVSSFTLSGSSFTLGTPSKTLPATLSSGQSISVPVTFTPQLYGANAGTLTANATGETATLDLSGQGETTNPSLSLSPNQVVFSAQPIGGNPVTTSETITNVSSSAITVTGFSSPQAPFSVTNPPSTPLTLEPSGQSGDSFSFTVQFDPPGSSGDFEHDFASLATVDTSVGNFGVAISGSADAPATLATEPTSLNFGSVAVGSSVTMNFELGDQGGFPLTITESTPPSTDGFSALTNPFTQLSGSSDEIAPNTSIEETVQFAPTADGPASATWQLEGNDGNGVQTVTLTGTGYTPSSGGGGGGGGSSPPSSSPPASSPPTTTTPPPTTTKPPVLILAITTRTGHVGTPLILKIEGDSHGGAVKYRVRRGTAKACILRGDKLEATGPGTCLVTAIREARGTVHAVTSKTTVITFVSAHDSH